MSSTIAAIPKTNFAPGIERALFREVTERSYTVDRIEGEIPAYLRGTYYLNGPAKFERGGSRCRNWLDGDGMVCALRFTDDGAHFTNRFVRSKKFVDENAAGRSIYRQFGTVFDGDRLKRGLATESPINVSVFAYRGHLLAFGEQSLPMELDPVTLETKRTFDFAGALNDISPFSAHPKIDPRTGELFNFGISFASRQPVVTFYRFNADGTLGHRKRAALDYACSTHDFAISEHYAVFYLSPYILDIEGLMREGLSTVDALRWQPALGSQILVLDRATGAEVARIKIAGRYCLHTINAFESAGRLLLDVIEFDRPVYDQYQELPELFEDAPFGQPARFEIDVAENRLVKKETIPYRSAADFPAIDPRAQTRPYDDLWMLGIAATGQRGRKFFDRLVHLNWSNPGQFDVHEPPPQHYFAGEPVFVADPRGTGGAVICHVFAAERPAGMFQVFDATNVGRGPRCTLHLEEPVHLGFHASFTPESFRSRIEDRQRAAIT